MKEQANGKNLIARAKDIQFVLDEIARRNQKDPLLAHQFDLKHIAVAGHSFGAGTSLAIVCPPVRDGGKTAPEKVYGSINIPGLLLTGTEDISPIGETSAEDRRIPFDGMRTPHQYLVNFNGADHSTFGGGGVRAPKESDEEFHKMIDKVTTEFLDATLKGDASAWHWLDSAEAPNYLGKSAVFEKK
jgi:predicted dienelactone hydrolase